MAQLMIVYGLIYGMSSLLSYFLWDITWRLRGGFNVVKFPYESLRDSPKEDCLRQWISSLRLRSLILVI